MTASTAAPIGANGFALAARIKAARAEQKRLAEQEAADKATLLTLMGAATEGTYRGVTVVVVKTQKRSGVNTKMLAELYPEAFDATRTESEGIRLEVK